MRSSPAPVSLFGALLALAALAAAEAVSPAQVPTRESADSARAKFSTLFNKIDFGWGPHRAYHSTEITSQIHHRLVWGDNDGLTTFADIRGWDAPWGTFTLYDGEGELVYAGERMLPMNAHKEILGGEPVLCYWTDTHSYGGYRCLDERYELVLEIAGDGTAESVPDPHEFRITKDDTAVVFFMSTREADLSFVGGPKQGLVWDSTVREIDIATNEVKFEWVVGDHIPPSSTFHPLPPGLADNPERAFDSHHLNSIEKCPLGNFLISLRGPGLILYVSGSTGEILWQIGGGKDAGFGEGFHEGSEGPASFKPRDFAMGPGVEWWYQHHARILTMGEAGPTRISFFENGANEHSKNSLTARAVILNLDHAKRTATLEAEYVAPFHATVGSAGSVQVLPPAAEGEGERVLVGWGDNGRYTVFDRKNSSLILEDVQLAPEHGSIHSYRVLRDTWVGRPATPPDFGVHFDPAVEDSLAGYASWNGATEVKSWRLLGGSRMTRLKSLRQVAKAGFETGISLSGLGTPAYLAAAAYDKDGECIGVSAVHSLEAGRSFGVYSSCEAIWWADWALTFNLATIVLVCAVCSFFGWRKLGRRVVGAKHSYFPVPPTPRRDSHATHIDESEHRLFREKAKRIDDIHVIVSPPRSRQHSLGFDEGNSVDSEATVI